MNPFRNSRGEGLISVMVSIAILGVLIVTVVTLYQMYGSMMAKSLYRREADLVANQVRGQLLRRSMCQTALAGNTWDGVSESDITVWRVPGQALAQAGMSLANGSLLMQKVFIRPFQVDADSDGTVDNLPSATSLRMGETSVTSRSGEVVIRFAMAGAGIREGLVAERRAAVMVLTDSGNAIVNCDINEESTKMKTCTVTQAAEDGFPCGANPHPGPPSECETTTFVGSVDAMGESKCHCQWSCILPFYQNRAPVVPFVCQAVAAYSGPVPQCPPETIAGPPQRGYCRNRLSRICRFKQLNPGACPPGFPYRVWEAQCLAPP